MSHPHPSPEGGGDALISCLSTANKQQKKKKETKKTAEKKNI